MDKKYLTEDLTNKLVTQIIETYEDKKGISHIEGLNLPNRHKIYDVLDRLFTLIFPGYIKGEIITKTNLNYFVGDVLNSIYMNLSKEIERALRYQCLVRQCEGCDCETQSEKDVVKLLYDLERAKSKTVDNTFRK